jgi:Rieske Fe-S protein
MKNIKKSEINDGEGKIFPADGGHGIAVYREGDKLSVLSTDCPHMHCNVNWHASDKTWICPCHGSQFDAEGKLMRGPAEKNLSKLEYKDSGEEIEVRYTGEEMHE